MQPPDPGSCRKTAHRPDRLKPARLRLATALRRTRLQWARWYDWAWISIETGDNDTGQRWLLIRRNTRTGELAFYHCYAPEPVPLATLVRVSGRRWTVEESFQASKNLTGLDQHQVRRWTWQRWTILSMLAYAFLTVLAITERATNPAPERLIALTCNEITTSSTTSSPADPRSVAPNPLVKLTTTTPAPRENQPLPAASGDRTVTISISDCRTR